MYNTKDSLIKINIKSIKLKKKHLIKYFTQLSTLIFDMSRIINCNQNVVDCRWSQMKV